MRRTALACSLLMVLAIAVTAAAPDGQETVPRDISAVMSGRFTFDGPWEGPWTTTGDVAGTMRHLGLAQMRTTHTADSGGTLSDGAFTIAAANGDEIRGTYTASAHWVSADQVQGVAVLSIAGGTGRFAGASGTIDADFLETFDDLSWASAAVTWSLTGSVRY